MASSSSSSSSSRPRTWKYRVFTSFHGPDVRNGFLTHLRKQFDYNGISMFDDKGIERGESIAPALTQAIRQSRISIVILSKNYAASGWCLNELVEIFKCKKRRSQIVMTVFYGVDPSHVRSQTGDFGEVFNKTCARKTDEARRKWSQALEDVANIAGEHLQKWDNEAKMIEKIARDVSNKLNTTISWDFEDMVGIETHLQKMQSLLHLEYEDEAMIVGISGPAGIGKTTIARALYSRLSSNFQLTCFMENLRGRYNSGLDDYGLKLRLQKKLLSKILNLNGMSVNHLGAIPERLCDQKVLIILDDVDDLQQLEALANETNWFGPGSRIIIITEDQWLLEQHGINITYHVDFPNEKEARKIFCRHAFRQSAAPIGFEKLVERVTELCGNLPLGLRVMGSHLRGKKEAGWESVLRRLEDSLDDKIDAVLRVGYDNLHKDDQCLFLLIAFFFNYQDDVHLKAMLADSKIDVGHGLETLANKSLIQISTKGEVVMHKLLQQTGREAVQRQEPGECQVLIDADEICDILENDYKRKSVMGISFDISTPIDDVNISTGAFKNMPNLRFLSIYKTRRDRHVRVHVPEDMDFPPRLRLLRWELYPGKCLPHAFRPQNLVELNLQHNMLEKLWDGTQPLTNLKRMDLSESFNLKELPDLSYATNLEKIVVDACPSLVEIHSTIGNLPKLEEVRMSFCKNLQVVPTLFNSASLESITMWGCGQLSKIPFISTNITDLKITDKMLEELRESISLWSGLQHLSILGSVTPNPVFDPIFPAHTGTDIERIPDWIRDLHVLVALDIIGCPKLASLPELPPSLRILRVDACESLETITPFPIDSRIKDLNFANCFKLGQEARRVITHQFPHTVACLPGRDIPAEFDHRALGSSLTISSDSYRFRVCLLVTPKEHVLISDVLVRTSLNGCLIEEGIVKGHLSYIRREHLLIFPYKLFEEGWLEQDNEVLFQFSTSSNQLEIVECGVQILTTDDDDDDDESIRAAGSYDECYEQVPSLVDDDDESVSDGSYKSCLEEVSGDDYESFSDGSNEFDEPRQ